MNEYDANKTKFVKKFADARFESWQFPDYHLRRFMGGTVAKMSKIWSSNFYTNERCLL